MDKVHNEHCVFCVLEVVSSITITDIISLLECTCFESITVTSIPHNTVKTTNYHQRQPIAAT